MRSVLRYSVALLLVLVVPPSARAAWTEPSPVSAEGGNSTFPAVAMNHQGEAAVAWYDAVNATTQMSRISPDGQASAPRVVSKLEELGGSPAIAMDPAGNVVVVYVGGSHANPREENGAKATFVSPGGDLRGPTTIGPALNGSVDYPGVGMDDAGNAIAWWDPVADERLMYSVAPSGHPFGPPKPIPNPASRLSRPSYAMAANGDAIATWTSGLQVFAAIRPAGGEFAPAQPLNVPTQGALAPHVAMAPNGAAVVAWVDHPDDHGDGFVHAAFRPAGGVFGPTRTLADVFYTGVYDVSVAMSPQGEATVMWIGGTQVPLRSWLTAFSLRPPGGDFGPPLEGFQAPCEEPPALAYDSSGNEYAACRRDEWHEEAWQYLGLAYGAARAAGASSFSESVTFTPPGRNVWSPALAAGPAGRAVAAWPRGWFPSPFNIEVASRSGAIPAPTRSPPPTERAGKPHVSPPPPRGGLARIIASLRAHGHLARRLTRAPVRLRIAMPSAGALGIRVWAPGRHGHLLARGRAVFDAAGPVALVLRPTAAGRRLLARRTPSLRALVTLHLVGQASTHARLRLPR